VTAPNGQRVWGEVTKTVVLPAGTVLHYSTACGTARRAKHWMVYRNDYRAAEAVTCAKCAKREAS
jgi:hypothetical protein